MGGRVATGKILWGICTKGCIFSCKGAFMGLAFFYTLFSYTEGCILNTTDNYQLNQWEGTDRILRTDFNADNLKTDDAVAELRETVDALAPKAGLQLIQEGTFGSSGPSYDLSLADIDWNQWKTVYIEVDPYAATSDPVSLKVNSFSNANFDYVSANTTPPGTTGKRERALLIFFPLFNENYCVSGMSFGTETPTVITMNTAFKDITHLQIASNNNITIHSTSLYHIWGEK